jgi:hypothetical protein
MIKPIYIYLIASFELLSNISYSQTDSIGSEKVLKSKFYFGIGGGFGSKGSTLGLSGTFNSQKNYGFTINLRTNILKNKDFPSDYFVDGNRVFSPKDYLNLISFTLLKEFPNSSNPKMWGIELGPAFVQYKVAQFERNPSYDKEAGLFLGNRKYNKFYSSQKTIGLAFRAKGEFLNSKGNGFEFAVFGNINNVQSVVGFELYFLTGS